MKNRAREKREEYCSRSDVCGNEEEREREREGRKYAEYGNVGVYIILV